MYRDAVILIAHEDSAPELRPGAAVLPGNATTKGELFDELASALHLPDYFGNNWDAFEETLGDIEPRDLIVRNARALWTQLPQEMALFVDVWLDNAPESQLVFFW